MTKLHLLGLLHDPIVKQTLHSQRQSLVVALLDACAHGPLIGCRAPLCGPKSCERRRVAEQRGIGEQTLEGELSGKGSSWFCASNYGLVQGACFQDGIGCHFLRNTAPVIGFWLLIAPSGKAAGPSLLIMFGMGTDGVRCILRMRLIYCQYNIGECAVQTHQRSPRKSASD